MNVLAYEDEFVRLWHGDGREFLRHYSGGVSAVVTDPPYGETSLTWDRAVNGWQEDAGTLAPQLWCFGSMRFHMTNAEAFERSGWKYGQEIIWEKHNGSGFHADRFKRVHEIAEVAA